MEYTVIENSSTTRYTATITFSESFYNYLLNGSFSILINDMLLGTSLEITDYNTLINQYGLTAPTRVPPAGKTTAECQLEDSLIKNKGIVIELESEQVLKITMIPRCSDATNTRRIGFYSSNIKIDASLANNPNVNIAITAKLFPRIIRSDEIIKDELKSYDDPILKDDTIKGIRPGYNFPVVFPINSEKVASDFNYNTENTVYVNTHEEEPSLPQVPLYISELSATFAAEGTDAYVPDWDDSDVESYLYDNRYEPGVVKIDIPFKKIDEPEVTELVIIETVENDFTVRFTTNLSTYKITQYIYKDPKYSDGRYENTLFFGLRAKHDGEVWPPVDPVQELYNPVPIYITSSTPYYVLSKNVNAEHFPLEQRSLIVNESEEPPVIQYGVDGFTVNLEPDVSDISDETVKKYNAFLFDGHYNNNVITFTTDIEYYDANNQQVGSIVSPLPKNKTIDNPIMTLSTDEILEWVDFTHDYANATYAKIVVHAQVSIDERLITQDPATTLCLIEQDPYYINVTEALKDSWRTKNIYTTWTKNYTPPPPPPPVYDPPTKPSMSTLTPMKKTGTEGNWIVADTRVLDIDRNLPDQYEFGKETFTVNLNNPFIKNGDKVFLDFRIMYHKPEELYVIDPVPIAITLVDGQTTVDISIDNYIIDLSGEYEWAGFQITSLYLELNNLDNERKQQIKDDYNIDISLGELGWNYISDLPDITKWTRNYNSFIPDIWEPFEKYVIFTQSQINLNGAYIGVKSITAPCVNVQNNSIVESELFVTGEYPLEGTDDVVVRFQSGTNTSKILADGRQINYTTAPNEGSTDKYSRNQGDALYTGVEGLTDKKVHITSDPTRPHRFLNENISYIGNSKDADGYLVDLYTDIEDPPELQQMQGIEFTGTESITLPDGGTYNFDAEVKDQFNRFTAGNNVTVTFKKGTYYFDTFTMDTHATIIIDPNLADNEYVRICVRGNFTISNMLDIINENTNLRSFMIYSHEGNITMAATTSNTYNYGILVAAGQLPNGGTVRFENTIIWTGAIWARNIILVNGSEVHSYDDQHTT